MMTTKERRDRLFKGERPHIRPFDLQKDFWVLWGAYDLGSFASLPKGWSKELFADYLIKIIGSHSSALVSEDKCKYFKEGRGPVSLILIDNYGWRVEPIMDFFKWTTPRMVLRSQIAFLQMVRYSSDIGVCLVRSPEKYQEWFNRFREYGVLFPCGRVPYGRQDGDETLYYVSGNRGKTKPKVNVPEVKENDHAIRATGIPVGI